MLVCPYISHRLGNFSSVYVFSKAASGPGRPIAPLCNTQENLPPAQVQAWEKQTPSVNCLLYTGLLGPPSPLLLLPLPPPIHPSPLFSSSSISAPRNLIIAGPHSHDLSLHTLLKTNRSGLRQGAREAERGTRDGDGGRGAGWKWRGPEEKPTYDEVLCDAEEKQQQHHSSQSEARRPSEHIPLSSPHSISLSSVLLRVCVSLIFVLYE